MLLRYERKYLVPYHSMDKLRARMMPFVEPDRYALNSSSVLSQYTVRSIYLDTPFLDCHEEKIAGVELRKKFRIRSYNTNNPEAIAVFEIKRKIGSRIKKHRAFCWYKDLEELMATADIDKYIHQNSEEDLNDASRFFFHAKKRLLKPAVLIVYEREAYHGRLDSGVRITFDKNIRSKLYPTIDQMFTNADLMQLFKNHFILEIKYFSDEMPSWAKSLVQEFRLRNDALSKYTIGYDVHVKQNVSNY